MKHITYILIPFFLIFGCREKKSEIIVLHYDLYNGDILERKNVVTIEYQINKGDSIKTVTFNSSIDSNHFSFREYLTDSGLYRSLNRSKFLLTHSFLNGIAVDSLSVPINSKREIQKGWNNRFPTFFSISTRPIDIKEFESFEKGKVEIIAFIENINFYSYTETFYCKQLGMFLIYKSLTSNRYYKLSKIDGLIKPNIEKDILKITNNLSNDTIFFGKNYKLPSVKPPPLMH